MKKTLILVTLFCTVLFPLHADDAVLKLPSRFDNVIDNACRIHGLDPVLVKALIYRESRFNPNAYGSVGEIGLMQIRRSVVRDWAKANNVKVIPTDEELYDPYLNVAIGTWKLASAMKRWKRYSTCTQLALVEYNAGRTRLATLIAHYNGDTLAAIRQGPSADYVRNILSCANVIRTQARPEERLAKQP